MGDGAIQDFVAGWFGGVTGLLVGHPFDTVKARLQTDGITGNSQYKGTFHCFKDIIKTEGARSLYKGMAAPMLGMAVINAIVFGVYGNIMKSVDNTMFNSLMAGSVAGAAQSIICCPMELIKLRMQMQKDPTELFHFSHTSSKKVYNDPLDAIKKIYRKGGVPGLYKGMIVTLFREVPGFGCYFLSYDVCCQLLMMRKKGMKFDDLSPIELCVAGGIGGIFAWISSYPFDVIKSRLQVDGMYGECRYNGTIKDCALLSYRESGCMVFWKGLNSTLLRAFAVNAATFPTVALILRYWRRKDS